MEAGERRIGKARGKVRPFPGKELQILPHGIGHDQDVGKQDSPVQPITPDRLKRDLGGRLGIVYQRQESALLCPQRAIFGQVAACLAHQPDRPMIAIFTAQGTKEQTGHRADSNQIQIRFYRMLIVVGLWIAGIAAPCPNCPALNRGKPHPTLHGPASSKGCPLYPQPVGKAFDMSTSRPERCRLRGAKAALNLCPCLSRGLCRKSSTGRP